MIENFRLKVFRTVAEQRHFRKAAEHLYLTQPAVTHQIRALEETLSVPLFDRTGKEIALTPSGEILLRYVRQVDELLARAEEVIGAVMGRRAALGLIEGPAHTRDVTVEPWIEDELVLTVPASHEWNNA